MVMSALMGLKIAVTVASLDLTTTVMVASLGGTTASMAMVAVTAVMVPCHLQ